MDFNRPPLLCTDLEGVLVPEIWIEFAQKTGIEALNLTTRDVDDYEALMAMRIDTLRQHGLQLTDVQSVIAQMSPLPGAADFVRWARQSSQLIILSDTFYEFAAPLMAQLGHPTIFCHSLHVDTGGYIVGWRRRLRQPKRSAVLAFNDLGFRTLAIGDSYNDISMLLRADVGLLFAPPDKVVADYPDLPVARTYTEARSFIVSSFLGDAVASAVDSADRTGKSPGSGQVPEQSLPDLEGRV